MRLKNQVKRALAKNTFRWHHRDGKTDVDANFLINRVLFLMHRNKNVNNLTQRV